MTLDFTGSSRVAKDPR